MYAPQANVVVLVHVRGDMPPMLRDWLSQPRQFLGHNIVAYDAIVLANHGVDIFAGQQWLDTMIAEQVLLPQGRRDFRKGLQKTLERRLRKTISKEFGTSSWMQPTLTPEQIQYCVEDVVHLPTLWREQQSRLTAELANALHVEQLIAPVLQRATLNGLPIDVERLATYRQGRAEAQAEAAARLKTLGVNPNSPKQVRTHLLTAHGVEASDTANDTLGEMAQTDAPWAQFARDVMLCRSERRRMGMYDDAWVEEYVTDGRVHPSFAQISMDTGRIAAYDPNVQQIPRDARHIIAAPDGSAVVSVDYKSIEFLVAAILAKDDRMLEDARQGDPHRLVASALFNVAESDVPKPMRQAAKAGSFNCCFGGSAADLARTCTLAGYPTTVYGGTIIQNKIFARYPRLYARRQRAQQQARTQHVHVLTFPTGLRRILSGKSLRSTVILNNSVQASAAAGLKLALLRCADAGLAKYLSAVVHDEIVAVVPQAEASDYAAELSACMIAGMRDVLGNEAPVQTEPHIGPTWDKE
jgi:DNA polymerase I-like protein with 3'-5' exonuclease and polymerase domains